MKKPNLKDFHLSQNIIDWFPLRSHKLFGTFNLPRKFSTFIQPDGWVFLLGSFIFLYLTWEIGGFVNKIDDIFIEIDLSILLIFSPIISIFTVYYLIPRFIKFLVFLILKKHIKNVKQYDEETFKYDEYIRKENIKKRKSYLLNKLKEMNFEFPFFDDSKYYKYFREVFIKGFTKIKELDNYHLKKFKDRVPSKIFKDLSKYRNKNIQSHFTILVGLSHLMKWDGFRDIVYSLGIVLPYYDNHYTITTRSDFRKLELDKLKDELEKEQYSQTYLYTLRIPEKLNSEYFFDLRFLEMTKLITYLDLLTGDKEIFDIQKFREKMFELIPINLTQHIINSSWKKSRLTDTYDPELINYYEKIIKKI